MNKAMSAGAQQIASRQAGTRALLSFYHPAHAFAPDHMVTTRERGRRAIEPASIAPPSPNLLGDTSWP